MAYVNNSINNTADQNFNCTANINAASATFGNGSYASVGSNTIPFQGVASNAGNTVFGLIENTDNTNSGSNAGLVIEVGGTSAGEARVGFVAGASEWNIGLSNAASQAFQISNGISLGSTNVITATTAGAVTMPLQPAFLAYRSAVINAQTGDGTIVTLPCNTVVFDQASNYNNGTFIFTAPVTGKYRFTANVQLSSIAAGHTSLFFMIITTGRAYGPGVYLNPAPIAVSGSVAFNHNCLANMTAGQTAYATIQVSGSTKTVAIQGSAPNTFFSGELVC